MIAGRRVVLATGLGIAGAGFVGANPASAATAQQVRRDA